MVKKSWALCAVILMSVNLTYAAENNTKEGVSPASLFKDSITGFEMVYVKGGCYQMGDIWYEKRKAEPEFIHDRPEERPVHEVCVDDFYMGKYEVTQGQWKSVMGNNTSALSTCSGDNCPVDNVSWNDVQDFISRLNNNGSGFKYRLPTEAEWEYAARSGGKSEMYSGGNDVGAVAWYYENSGVDKEREEKGRHDKNHPVGTKSPNGLGIYDMSGNVWEMTNDWYRDEYYSSSPRKNPAGPGSGDGRTLRGGCTSGDANNQRTSRRKNISEYEVDRDGTIGFRLLRLP